MRRSGYLTILFVIFFLHATLHLGIYKLTSLNISFLESKCLYQQFKTQALYINDLYPPLQLISQIVLIAEVVFIVFGVILAGKQKKEPEIVKVQELKEQKAKVLYQINTDLDRLYEALKQKKKIKISEIASTYKVSNDIALEWCKTLELGKLAALSYPRFSEPTLILKEKAANEK